MFGKPLRSARSPWPARALIAAAVAATLTLPAACGGSESATQEPDGTTTFKVSNPANVSNVPLHIAMDKGFFKAENLNIKADIDLGSGSTAEAVVGGQVDMAWTNSVGGLTLYTKGFDLKLVAVTDMAVTGSQQVLVKKDSPAKTLADLKGKKMAVLSPNTICILIVKAALKAQGLPEDSIQFTPVSPPEHANVLSSGEVAATCTSDPFRALMIDELGARSVFETSSGELAGYPVGGYIVSEKFAKENAEALAGFQRALYKATQYANANPAAVKEALPKFTTIEPEVAQHVIINRYVEAGDAQTVQERVQRIADAMHAYGMSDKQMSVDDYFLGSE
ncbi:ABC transporter substrate-binding protein [Actinomadura sp. 1N219]|uniref:ABC transporter substrate-binding protein n=1 Tax=Actinomadura sp. 1N219 TaxID=3375152 RepID=UPI003787DDFA